MKEEEKYARLDSMRSLGVDWSGTERVSECCLLRKRKTLETHRLSDHCWTHALWVSLETSMETFSSSVLSSCHCNSLAGVSVKWGLRYRHGWWFLRIATVRRPRLIDTASTQVCDASAQVFDASSISKNARGRLGRT